MESVAYFTGSLESGEFYSLYRESDKDLVDKLSANGTFNLDDFLSISEEEGKTLKNCLKLRRRYKILASFG